MATNSKIEWTDHTFNPWIGCQKVSPGCDHCYAEDLMATRYKRTTWGPHGERIRTSAANWHQPRRWNAQARAFAALHGRRQRVFCASLADVFDNKAPAGARADLFRLISETPDLDWLLLTKRPENALAMHGIMPRNVWLGTTVEDQPRADHRVQLLIDAAGKLGVQTTFLSCEPLLGPVDLRPWLEPSAPYARINWVICGGESGPHARPMHPGWARSLRDQCAEAGVPFLFKQWGEWGPGYPHPVSHDAGALTAMTTVSSTDRRQIGRTSYLAGSGPDRPSTPLEKVGKARAGRLLDGVEHLNWPETHP